MVGQVVSLRLSVAAATIALRIAKAVIRNGRFHHMMWRPLKRSIDNAENEPTSGHSRYIFIALHGPISFCGEHTENVSRGVEGALASAERVALEILAG